ncbi:MAG: L-seryl-tRNA(Sec) selenium transferase, partial [Deltaproteobacteria bacterium HGW-Deltaproteobacteria-17]
DLPTAAVALTSERHTANELEEGLRGASTPVISRIHEDRVLLDVRTLMGDDLTLIAAALSELAAGGDGAR